MILHNLILCLLLYTMSTMSHPINEEKSITEQPTNPSSINGLMDPISDTYSDVGVDTLITKMTQISERYRKDVNGTIADVQQIILNDQELPRLTRGEIIDLLENLTKTDPEVLKEKISKGRQEYQRAIMLVMPYTPKNSDNFNIEELFTKPPITQIVGSETSKPMVIKKPHNTNKHIEILAVEPSTARPTFVKRPAKPQKFTKASDNNQEIRNQTKYVEQKPRKEITKLIPARQEVQVVSTTTRKPFQRTTRFPNHRYPDDHEFTPSHNGMKVISPPKLVRPKPTQELLKADESKKDLVSQVYDEPIKRIPKPEITTESWKPTEEQFKPIVEPVKPHRHIYKATVSSTIRPRIRSTTTTSTTESALADIDVPNDMKDAVKDIDFGDMKPIKFHSQYDEASINFPKQTSTENVRDLLDSIGALHLQSSTTMIPGISEVADNLSPDMRELLMTFGLLEDPNKPKQDPTETPTQIRIEDSEEFKPYSYSQFKPLPDSAPTREDMEEFLAGFGLGNSQRVAKNMKTINSTTTTTEEPKVLSQVPTIDMDMIPESMHDIMEDIGLSQKKSKYLPLDLETTENKQQTHVFNPDQTNVSENEIQRLGQLLDTIKRLEKMNRTATPEDLQDLDLENIRELTKILKQEQQSSVPLDQQQFGPDPLDFDSSAEKNEVKRQQSTTTTTTTTTEGSPSLTALEESFGGNAGTAAGNTPVDETLPAPRRTGFYYLVDWNTFLEVGEDEKKTSIRFSPQAGDPSRFLRVNVP